MSLTKFLRLVLERMWIGGYPALLRSATTFRGALAGDTVTRLGTSSAVYILDRDRTRDLLPQLSHSATAHRSYQCHALGVFMFKELVLLLVKSLYSSSTLSRVFMLSNNLARAYDTAYSYYIRPIISRFPRSVQESNQYQCGALWDLR